VKEQILNYTKEDLEKIIQPKFRAKQIFGWIYEKRVDSFLKMENLPKQMRQDLEDKYTINSAIIVSKQISVDGSIKYLFKLHDGHTVEAVLLLMRDTQYNDDGSIKHLPKYTVCVSSQVGCKVGCAFCFTAKGGFIRDLSSGEIVEQILQISSMGKTVPAGITRMVVSGRVLRLNLDLERLKVDEPHTLKSAWLNETVYNLIGDHHVRYYEEPVYLLDE